MREHIREVADALMVGEDAGAELSILRAAFPDRMLAVDAALAEGNLQDALERLQALDLELARRGPSALNADGGMFVVLPAAVASAWEGADDPALVDALFDAAVEPVGVLAHEGQSVLVVAGPRLPLRMESRSDGALLWLLEWGDDDGAAAAHLAEAALSTPEITLDGVGGTHHIIDALSPFDAVDEMFTIELPAGSWRIATGGHEDDRVSVQVLRIRVDPA